MVYLSRLFEAVARLLANTVLLGAEEARTRDAIQLTEPSDPGVVVLVTPEAVEVRLPTVEWGTRLSRRAGCGGGWGWAISPRPTRARRRPR